MVKATKMSKREFLILLKNINDILEDRLGIEGLRKIVASKIPSTIRLEWERITGLGLLQEVLHFVWR